MPDFDPNDPGYAGLSAEQIAALQGPSGNPYDPGGGAVADNPYAPTGREAVVQALMDQIYGMGSRPDQGGGTGNTEFSPYDVGWYTGPSPGGPDYNPNITAGGFAYNPDAPTRDQGNQVPDSSLGENIEDRRAWDLPLNQPDPMAFMFNENVQYSTPETGELTGLGGALGNQDLYLQQVQQEQERQNLIMQELQQQQNLGPGGSEPPIDLETPGGDPFRDFSGGGGAPTYDTGSGLGLGMGGYGAPGMFGRRRDNL